MECLVVLTGSNPLFGDLICIVGGFGAAVANVGEEVVIKGELSVLDFTALIGFSGAIVSGIQMYYYDICNHPVQYICIWGTYQSLGIMFCSGF